jgi:hypothetical protein
LTFSVQSAAVLWEGAIKPKLLVLVILVFVALFVFSTIGNARGKPGLTLTGDLPLVNRMRTNLAKSLDQPVKAKEITLAGAAREEVTLAGAARKAGCAWDGKKFSVPANKKCRFTVWPDKRALWQLNSTKRLRLRLTGAGTKVTATLARMGKVLAGEQPQVETLKNSPGATPPAVPSPGPGTPTRAAPTPAPQPTPSELTVYDPDDQGLVWLLTLEGCDLKGEGTCQVELVE